MIQAPSIRHQKIHALFREQETGNKMPGNRGFLRLSGGMAENRENSFLLRREDEPPSDA
jgi:hypothetical protein